MMLHGSMAETSEERIGFVTTSAIDLEPLGGIVERFVPS
jgi:hypothetical protein